MFSCNYNLNRERLPIPLLAADVLDVGLKSAHAISPSIMRRPKNIDAPVMSVIAMGILLLGGARDPWVVYTAFAIQVVAVVLMAYWYRKAISQAKLKNSGGSAREADSSNARREEQECSTSRPARTHDPRAPRQREPQELKNGNDGS
jgi:hypothetical protein